MLKRFSHLISLCFVFLFTAFTNAQHKFDNVEITSYKLAENIYMLEGAGGNIGVSVGETGIFIIDSQFAPLTKKITDALKTLGNAPVKLIVNTHHHGDHTGGNSNFSKQGATIMAHDNVKKRLRQNKPKAALPIITYSDRLKININDEEVFIMHVDHAHTDGDSLLYFTESNVLHTGDTFFNGRYPYIDLNSGGSVDGYIKAVKAGMVLIDANTKIIPGHGKLSNEAGYKDFLDMLESLKTKILIEIEQGKTEAQVASNAALTKHYDDLGYGCCFISSEKIRRTFYKSLKK